MADVSSLIEKLISYAPSADINIIIKAANFAEKHHEGQTRLSGDPYISHPIAVATILADLEQDSYTIAAALLHDIVEDCQITDAELDKMVAGVTKLGKLTFGSKEERQAENFRKMFIAMAEDIRIIIIKLADRLHNMQTLKYLRPEKQLEIARETREIYAPLAHRLGIWSLKWELEDLSFYYLDRDKFEQIKNLVAQKRTEREKFMNDFIEQVSAAIKKVGINSAIAGRTKHFVSIYNKLVQKNVEFDDIYDLIAIRVVVDSVKDCYAVFGIVHSIWKPIPGRFRDFIAVPKSNGYQTLHTTVMGPFGKPVEIQIRTREMHRIAEYGVAAHWKYKEGHDGDRKFDAKLAWIRQMLDQQKEINNAKDFLENLKIDLFIDEVFVYSPKGDVYDLPINATPIDFAYHVHTQVGHRCVGAKVNGKIVTLDYWLKNGDIIEILTSNKDNPRLDWLNFTKTSGAKTKIKNWFKKQKREENIERGKDNLFEELEKAEIENAQDHLEDYFSRLDLDQPVDNLDDFFAMIGHGEISAFKTAKDLRALMEKDNLLTPATDQMLAQSIGGHALRKSDKGISVSGIDNIMTRLSKCCFPLPGDEIAGYVTKGRGVSIHRADCPNIAPEQEQQKLVPVEWSVNSEELFNAYIEVEAFDRVGVLKDILAQISETKTNIVAVDIKTKRGSNAVLDIVVDIRNVDHLKDVMASIRKISDVYDVYRVTTVK